MFAEDEAVMRDTGREKRWPWAILDAQKEMLLRPMPNVFTVHKVRFNDSSKDIETLYRTSLSCHVVVGETARGQPLSGRFRRREVKIE